MSLSITPAVVARMLHAERGQGTVEYVGIVLAVAALLVAVAAAIDNKVGGPIATALVHRLQEAVTQVGNAKHG
jgi:Flp pilus assembly pilin Flp